MLAVIIMRDIIMRGDYARDDARYYARLNLTVTTDVCSIGWLSRAMMCVDKGGVVGLAQAARAECRISISRIM